MTPTASPSPAETLRRGGTGILPAQPAPALTRDPETGTGTVSSRGNGDARGNGDGDRFLSSPNLLIIILNYRTPALTIDCLRSLAPSIEELPATKVKVLLIDNASNDDSLPRLTQAITDNGWSPWCHLLANPTNEGFAGGNNRGLSLVPTHYPDTDYVLFLNSDTLVPKGTLPHCLAVMQRNPDIGALSCKLLNPDGTTQNTARRFPTPVRQTINTLGLPWHLPRLFAWANLEDPTWDRTTESRDVDWLGGAFLLIPRPLLDQIGGLNERFFFYGEDIELSHRIKQQGRRRHYDPTVSITHLGGASSDPIKLPAKQKSTYAWHARYTLQRQCYGPLAPLWLRALDITTYTLRVLKLTLTGRAKTPESQAQRAILHLLLHPLTPGGR